MSPRVSDERLARAERIRRIWQERGLSPGVLGDYTGSWLAVVDYIHADEQARIARLTQERDQARERVRKLREALYKGGCGRDERCYRCAQCEREDRALVAQTADAEGV